ncbi:2-oxoglutarate and iron-dependent oxygenase domain-containing protein [Flammeovirgaceae bacterium]
MTELLFDEIPSLDLADFISENDSKRKKFVDDLGEAYQQIGFVAIRNHFLTDALSAKLYKAVKSFFDLEEVTKQKYEIPELAGQRGYAGKGKEHAKGRNSGDFTEFYHIGQDVTDKDPIKEQYPNNVWPEIIPDFKSTSLEVYRRLEQTGMEILKAISLYLELPENYFSPRVKNGNSILRPIHYFPIKNSQEIPPDAVRAAEHGDINLITLLMGASADGLQVLRRDGKWIPITALPNQLIINVGDMLERLTNGKLKSTIHRVVNPPTHLMNMPRYSIPFFMHPRSEMNLAALSNCVDEANPKKWDDITAGEFLNQRLKEIGLRK